MRKHEIPRESQNEGRILYIFNGRSILTTIIGIVFGFVVGIVLKMALPKLGMPISLILFGLIGFGVGTIKIPEINTFPVTKSIGGMYIDEAILKHMKFKKRRSLKVLEKEE